MISLYSCLVHFIRLNLRHDIKLKVFETESPIMVVCADLPVDINEHHKVRNKLIAFEINFALALRQINVVPGWSVAGLHLHQFFYLWIQRVDHEIATCKVCPQTTGVVGRNAMHPALR